jgi:hypothetical protein
MERQLSYETILRGTQTYCQCSLQKNAHIYTNNSSDLNISAAMHKHPFEKFKVKKSGIVILVTQLSPKTQFIIILSKRLFSSQILFLGSVST